MARIINRQALVANTWTLIYSATQVGRADVTDGQRCREITVTVHSGAEVEVRVSPSMTPALASGTPAGGDKGFPIGVGESRSFASIAGGGQGFPTLDQVWVRSTAASVISSAVTID